LDIGCGSKPYESLFKNVTNYIGVDIESSGHDHTDSKVDLYYDGKKLPFDDNYFDCVVSFEVLEHVFNIEELLSEIKRVMKKGGYGIFLVPAETLLFRIVWYFWKNYYVGKIWQNTHLHAYSDSYLVKLAREVGFKIEVDKKIIFGCLHLVKVRK